MYAIAISILGTLLIALHLSVSEPQEISRHVQLQGDVAAANFYAYRRSVVDYFNANPAATGTIADSALTFPLGYIRNPDWTNFITGGQLYVYSTSVQPAAVVDAIATRGGRTFLIGTKVTGGTMTSVSGSSSGIPLPAAIPVGGVVIIGK